MNIGTFSNFLVTFGKAELPDFSNILLSQEISRVITTPSLCSTTVKQVNRLLADFLDQNPAAIWPSMLLTFVFQHSCSLWMSDWDKKENTKNSFHFLLNQLDVMGCYITKQNKNLVVVVVFRLSKPGGPPLYITIKSIQNKRGQDVIFHFQHIFCKQLIF